MDALMFLNEAKRMCKSFKDCEGCPFREEECCPAIIGEKAEQVIQSVERWSKDHPQKTRLQDFLEKYPNAPMEADGTPKVCCENIGYYKACDESGADCKKCWNKVMEDDE